MDIFLLQGFLLAEANGKFLLDAFSASISLHKVNKPGKLGEWYSPSTSFIDLSGRKE